MISRPWPCPCLLVGAQCGGSSGGEVSRQGELVLIESEANGFLPHQIRMTNGILVEVGLGRLPVEAIGDLTGGPPREPRHVPSLPARGLCLVEVKYQKIPWGATDDREAV